MLDKGNSTITFFLLGCFFLGGCSSSSWMAEEKKGEEQKVSIEEYERTFNPSVYNEEIRTKPTSPKQTPPPLTLPQDSLPMQAEIVQGYRIQVYSSSSFDEANDMRNVVAEQASPDSVYILFDPPVYKVRVGDYSTRYEANQRLLFFVNAGYRDAWVVPDRIIIRRRIPTQSSESH